MRVVNAPRDDAQTRSPVPEGRYCSARAYRNGELICGRVELTVTADIRFGLTSRERRHLVARFAGAPPPDATQ